MEQQFNNKEIKVKMLDKKSDSNKQSMDPNTVQNLEEEKEIL